MYKALRSISACCGEELHNFLKGRGQLENSRRPCRTYQYEAMAAVLMAA